MNASYSTNLFTNSCDHIFTHGKAPPHSHINHNKPQFLYSLWRRANAPNPNPKPFTVAIQPLSTRLIKPNFFFDLSHRRSTTVLETRNSCIVTCHVKCITTIPLRVFISWLTAYSLINYFIWFLVLVVSELLISECRWRVVGVCRRKPSHS